MKLLLTFFILIGSCSTTKYSRKVEAIKNDIIISDTAVISALGSIITHKELKFLVDTLASKTFEGRKVGSSGLEKATTFIKNYYIKQNILPVIENSYLQSIPDTLFSELKGLKNSNILAFIKGSEKPDETIVISAHIDHLGKKDSLIYYGADDNASGTAAIMQIAKAFQVAKKKGCSPKRSVLIAHFTAEETGLQGSRFYASNPVFDLQKTIADLNIDMIGRVNKKYSNSPNYIYVIGADRLSKELHFISEKINNTFSNLTLDYTYNDEDDPNKYYYRSDHYSFASMGIPSIFYFNGSHKDYHKPTDTREKINFPLLEKRTKLVFYTAWYLANMKNKLILNSEI